MKIGEMHRQVGILASAQGLFQTVSVMVMTIGGLAGAQVSDNPLLATLPIASMFLGTALCMFPASWVMARVGRRNGFLLGAGLGMIGGLTAAMGIWVSKLALLATGTFFIGAYQAFAQFYRFAASELANPAFRPKAIALVLTGGIVAALLGPELTRLGAQLPGPGYFAAFALLAAIALLAFIVLLYLKMPKSELTATRQESARPWHVIVLQPRYLVALIGATTGYGVMILAMTATPLAMIEHHHSFASAAGVIQLHVLAMFLPSFITGSLIARFGSLRLMMAGIVLLALHVACTATGTGLTSFASALVLLGVGWNFLFIGGTSLLTTTYSPAEQSRAQATNDLVIFIVGLACSFGAGGLLSLLGWQKMNGLLLPWLALTGIFILCYWLKAGKQ